MTHKEKIQWMTNWCVKNNCKLELKVDCGFGRNCVGISYDETYPDYKWCDENYNRIDNNGRVWTPKDAYHKHPCVAVLGHGEEAEKQLYDWLKWFDENNFVLEVTKNPDFVMEEDVIMGRDILKRMVRKPFLGIYKYTGEKK